MNLLEQLLAIARNTAIECIRQPVVLAVLAAGTLLVILSIPFSGFTMMDDQRMFVDIALSTVFVSGAVLAAFLATNALSREIDNRTVLTVVSKPVGRPVFVWGKFLGVAAALTACTLLLALVLMLVEMHGTMQTASTPYHMPVIVIGILSALLAVGAATWANYFYGWSFPASVVGFGVPLLSVAYLLCLLFQKDWTPVAPSVQFKDQLWLAIALMWLGLCVLASVAVAVSTRFGQVVTLGVTLGVFVTGLMSNWLIGRRIRDLGGMVDRLAADGNAVSGADRAQLALMKAAYAVLPNSQVFWMSDAVQQKRAIPLAYVLPTAAYGLLMVFAVMCVATALFQRREVG